MAQFIEPLVAPKLAFSEAACLPIGNDRAMSTEHDYIEAKAAWLRENPGATPSEVERACREIAERLGL